MDLKRKIAVEGLIKVENSGFSNLVFSALIDNCNLNAQDKSFAAKLFYGTIERKITLDFILQNFLSKPITKLDKEISAIMRSGLYQILYMEAVPPHAAINQAVSLCPVFKKTSAKGLVNAVLRKSVDFCIEDVKFANENQRLSVLYSINSDIIDIIKRDYPDIFEDILKGMFTLPKLSIRVNTIKTTMQEFKNLLDKSNVKYQDTQLEDYLVLDYRGAVTTVPGFRDGLFFVQGVTSGVATKAADIKQNDNVLDLCAAPGGKSFAASIELLNTGSVTSCDPNTARFSLIESGAERLGITNIKIMQNFAEIYNKDLEEKDVVLCDVPCSGLGIIPKKPDLRYKSMQDIDSLCELQYQILSTGARYVKTNGKLVYSTCTINKQENDGIVDRFLKENDNFKAIKIFCPINNVIEKEKKITFLSHLSGFDGFYLALLEKMW